MTRQEAYNHLQKGTGSIEPLEVAKEHLLQMSVNEYQKLAERTINSMELSKEEQTMHAVLGMNSEAGEVAGLFQKCYQGHTIDEEHLKKELGDLLWFIAEMCTANNWEMEEICQMNIDKLIARFPHGFEVDKSLHRKDGDI